MLTQITDALHENLSGFTWTSQKLLVHNTMHVYRSAKHSKVLNRNKEQVLFPK
jgi:hypothetical protein